MVARLSNGATGQKRGQSPSLNGGRGYRTTISAPAAIGGELKTFMEFVPSPYRAKYRDAIRIRGTEWLGNVTVPANAVAGTMLRNDYIQPNEFANSRLAQFGQLYEKFLFQKLDMLYTPAVGSNQVGSILLAYDRDISDATPPASEQGIRQYLSWEDSVEGNVWSPHVMRTKLEAPDAGYYSNPVTGGDDRVAYQGQTYVALVNPCGNSSALLIGNVCIQYVLDLFVPQLETITPTLQVQNATTFPTAADALRQYATTAAGVAFTAASRLGWLPKLQASGSVVNAIRLAEGVYRMVNRAEQTAAAGSFAFSTPVITTLEPAPAPAPQPAVRALANLAGLPSGNAVADFLLAIPKGGADVSQASNGAGVVDGTVFSLDRIGPYMADLSGIF